MKKEDKVEISPVLTGKKYWIDAVVIDVEANPSKGTVIAAKDDQGRIFFGEEKYFIPASSHVPNEETIAAIEEARSGKSAGIVDLSSREAFIKSLFDDDIQP